MQLNKTNISIISIPTLCTFFGFVVGLKYDINDKTNNAIQYMIAGVLFATLATEIVPVIIESEVLRHRFSTILGLILGAAVMISTRTIMLTKKIDESAELFFSGAIDVTVGGLLIGTSTVTVEGFKKFILSGALSIDNFFLGMILARKMKDNGKKIGYIMSAAATLSACVFVSGIIGLYISSKNRGGVFYFALSFGVAALLWLIGAELITTDTTSLLYPSMLYGGFIFIILLNWIK